MHTQLLRAASHVCRRQSLPSDIAHLRWPPLKEPPIFSAAAAANVSRCGLNRRLVAAATVRLPVLQWEGLGCMEVQPPAELLQNCCN